jgi:hypothetical protein
MGSSIALFLARNGAQVSIFDAAHAPFTGASRWNEGKIHLGFLYAGDRSLRTAERLLPGGLAFKDLVEELIGQSLDSVTTPSDDIYLVHRNSVVASTEMGHRFQAIGDMIRASPRACRYLTDVSDCRVRPVERAELESIVDTRSITAGFQVPERSVSTQRIADGFVDALDAEPRIESVMGVRVSGVRPRVHAEIEGSWLVEADSAIHGPYDHVINALWAGRPEVDSTIGLRPEAPWSHRFRLGLFVRTTESLDVPSAVIGTGPFGDVKNYNGRDFYLSWYPAGLVADGNALAPPELPDLNDALHSRVRDCTWKRLSEMIPPVGSIASAADKVVVNGGWVFAVGDGSLSNPLSTLHRRDRIGVHRCGSYISIDTGKYSIAPWLARRVTDSLLEN